MSENGEGSPKIPLRRHQGQMDMQTYWRNQFCNKLILPIRGLFAAFQLSSGTVSGNNWNGARAGTLS
jgi:hypothetical protein